MISLYLLFFSCNQSIILLFILRGKCTCYGKSIYRTLIGILWSLNYWKRNVKQTPLGTTIDIHQLFIARIFYDLIEKLWRMLSFSWCYRERLVNCIIISPCIITQLCGHSLLPLVDRRCIWNNLPHNNHSLHNLPYRHIMIDS